MFAYLILYFHLCAHIYFSISKLNFNECKSVTVNYILSLSINIQHTVMCTFVLLKWIYVIHKKCGLLGFNTVTVILTVAIIYIR